MLVSEMQLLFELWSDDRVSGRRVPHEVSLPVCLGRRLFPGEIAMMFARNRKGVFSATSQLMLGFCHKQIGVSSFNCNVLFIDF